MCLLLPNLYQDGSSLRRPSSWSPAYRVSFDVTDGGSRRKGHSTRHPVEGVSSDRGIGVFTDHPVYIVTPVDGTSHVNTGHQIGVPGLFLNIEGKGLGVPDVLWGEGEMGCPCPVWRERWVTSVDTQRFKSPLGSFYGARKLYRSNSKERLPWDGVLRQYPSIGGFLGCTLPV